MHTVKPMTHHRQKSGRLNLLCVTIVGTADFCRQTVLILSLPTNSVPRRDWLIAKYARKTLAVNKQQCKYSKFCHELG